jgi:hypothetical protein
MASGRRDKPSLAECPWPWADYSKRDSRDRWRSEAIQIRSTVRGMARPRASTTVERRQRNERLGGISKRGDGYIRRLLVHGARAIVGWRKRSATHKTPWIERLLARRPTNVATVAYANKLARIAWAIMMHGNRYNPALAFATIP